MNRSPRLARNLSLAATLTSLLISSTLAADTKSPGQSSRRTGKLPVPGKPPTGGKPGQGFTPLSLPDSLAGDFHAAWALRARVARAYWPQWLEKPTAPIFVRSRPFDFFINDSDPALPATSPRDIPGGGGFFQGSLEKTLPPAEPGMRIEAQGAKWLVLLDAQGGRGGTRSDLAALIAYRDFLVYETMIAKPVFFTADDNKRVADLRINRAYGRPRGAKARDACRFA